VESECGEECEPPGSTKGCSRSCSYEYCEEGICKTGTKKNSGTRTCKSTDCTWGSCSASPPSCPADECSVDEDCCVDECGPEGAKQCLGNVIQECRTDGDVDPCLEWKDITWCDDSDDWYDVGSPYDCCSDDGESVCQCQDQEYRDYSCNPPTATCESTITDTRTVKSGCNDCNVNNGYYCSETSGSDRCDDLERDTKEWRDYYCDPATATCEYIPSDQTDCLCNASDTDADIGNPISLESFNVRGTCTDYKGCSAGDCVNWITPEDSCIDETRLNESYVFNVSMPSDDWTCAFTEINCSEELGSGSGYDHVCYYRSDKGLNEGRCIEINSSVSISPESITSPWQEVTVTVEFYDSRHFENDKNTIILLIDDVDWADRCFSGSTISASASEKSCDWVIENGGYKEIDCKGQGGDMNAVSTNEGFKVEATCKIPGLTEGYHTLKVLPEYSSSPPVILKEAETQIYVEAGAEVKPQPTSPLQSIIDSIKSFFQKLTGFFSLSLQ
jgi:hypothetical protein